MKLKMIIILLAVLVNNSFAQIQFNSESEAKNIIADIIAVIGLKPNFEVQIGKVDNAAAVISDSKRYILYNPEFITKLNKAAGNNWASISILAHEIGHHLDGHTLEAGGSRPEIELEADEFSGFVLRRMGATLKDAQTAMRIAADYKRSLTHPGQAERLTAIAKGWNTADKQQGGKDLAKTDRPKQKITQPKEEQVITRTETRMEQTQQRTEQRRTSQTRTSKNDQLADAATHLGSSARMTNPAEPERTRQSNRGIIADVSFTADNESSYFITDKFTLVKEMNNRLAFVARMISTDSQEYPYIITDDEGTKLWVDNRGNIVNKENKTIGLLKVRS